MTTIKVTFDSCSMAWLHELHRRVSAFADLVEKPVDLLNLIRDLPRGAAAFDLECVRTPRTDDCRIVLKPCEAMLRFMTAMRAFDGDVEFIDDAPSLSS